MTRNLLRLIIVMSLILLCTTATAKNTNWKDPAFDFKKVKTIFMLDPTFTFINIPETSKNKFNKYPNFKEKINVLLEERLKKKKQFRIVSSAYIEEQIKGDPDLPLLETVSSEIFAAALPKHVNLVLETKVNDFGWYYYYVAAYDTTETQMERVKYGGVTPEGKEYSGWIEIPKTVTVHHDAYYDVSDCAEIEMRLIDPVTQKSVWIYTDIRSRDSRSWTDGYDKTGPESMMNRILNEAFKKIPLS
ncbi:hypothetical protein EV210_11385 [Anaerospora hongkongensis]|uniref:DUF4136 domain-containing protein n=1 Tax=Anaerospora hongkongensis TaxID=244830 RepID=A0A4R1PTU3_9FIRM|nr:hypothetical protein [Anaerospora hongkongensis]TCL35244.1 hypothetical protein EV210_11385 [Anaerospora hongkongensis]